MNLMFLSWEESRFHIPLSQACVQLWPLDWAENRLGERGRVNRLGERGRVNLILLSDIDVDIS